MTTRRVACVLPFLLVVGCSDYSIPQSSVEDVAYRPLRAQREPPVAGHALPPAILTAEATGTPFRASDPVWPGPSRVAAALDAPGAVHVEALSRAVTTAVGIDGVVLRVSSADAPGAISARLTLDYQAFRYAYGGDWASRLALWTIPDCALSSPEAPGCQGKKLASINDVSSGTISAVVDIAGDPGTAGAGSSPGALVMLAATASGSGGDYTATSLSPSATWAAGGNSGDFSWSYPLRVPPSLGGPAPRIAFDYSSSSVDGRMASTNNQPSWIGEGFDWQPGSIERRYRGCAEDMGTGANNTEKTGDLCWETDNAVLSL